MNRVILLTLAAGLVFSATAHADKTAGQGVDDTTVQSAVKAKLIGDDFFGGSAINTEVRKGVVQLGGFIDYAEEGKKAAAVAATVDGAKLVDNQLHVRQGKASMGQKLDDRGITTKVKASIADADFGDGFKVNVDTYNGVVLLTGFVDTPEKKATAGNRASNVANVKSVINGIYVLN
ncbi:MAG TPA: BON domain-containing protein [Xanthomonadales bacterium]|nr:BON domain-containing protein [Xanthomonadales bacterium]